MSQEVCRDFQKGHCNRGTNCRYAHTITTEGKSQQDELQYSRSHRRVGSGQPKPRNTECFDPMKKPVDMRIVFDMDKHHVTVPLITTRDVLVCPNIFARFQPGEIYAKLLHEIRTCGIPQHELLKLWHGNERIEGTHLIVNDRCAVNWKERCPTFNMVVDTLRNFFDMSIQATRFNWYADTSHWKPFHHDSAYVDPQKAKVQNFTVAASFGCTRDAAFEHAKTKTVVSIPQDDGIVYCFASDTNGIWRHGILQDIPTRPEGRISIICWGWIDNMGRVAYDVNITQ